MTPRTPPGRYGVQRPPRAFYLVGGALLIALSLVIVYLGRQAGDPAVSYGVRAFTTSERSVRITFEVRKASDAAATCVLRARDRHGAEVGRRAVTIGAGQGGTTVVVLTETVTTSARPVTGEVDSCRTG